MMHVYLYPSLTDNIHCTYTSGNNKWCVPLHPITCIFLFHAYLEHHSITVPFILFLYSLSIFGNQCIDTTIIMVCMMLLSVHVVHSLFISQTIGVTATLPDQVSYRLRPLGGARSDEWYYSGRSLHHNRKRTEFPHLPSLDGLRTGVRVAIQITDTGKMSIFFNGKFAETIASGLPTDTHLYGAVDVCWDCSKIKSELLSGELDGVCMDVYSS